MSTMSKKQSGLRRLLRVGKDLCEFLPLVCPWKQPRRSPRTNDQRRSSEGSYCYCAWHREKGKIKRDPRLCVWQTYTHQFHTSLNEVWSTPFMKKKQQHGQTVMFKRLVLSVMPLERNLTMKISTRKDRKR